MKQQTREEPKILAAAERQMKVWAWTQEIRDRIRVHQAHVRLGPYMCISREAGAGGSWIAEQVGQILEWEVLDRGLLDRVAERCHVSRSRLDLVDETCTNWAFDVLGTWFDREIVPHEKYLVHMSRVVLAAARQGNVVFVGRGAQFLLPREHGLAVRIIAPEKYRLDQIVQQRKLAAKEARRFMEAVDRGRREFVQRYFHQDIDDPHLYDVVVNVEHMGPEAAAEKIAEAMRHAKER